MYPNICKYGKFPLGHPKLYVGARRPPECIDREGIMKCKVLLLGSCIIHYFHTNAILNRCFHCVLLVPKRWTKRAVTLWWRALHSRDLVSRRSSQSHRYGLWCSGCVWILGVFCYMFRQTPIQVAFLQNMLTCSWNWNRNHLAFHPGFKVRITRTGTLRTTGAQTELL